MLYHAFGYHAYLCVCFRIVLDYLSYMLCIRTRKDKTGIPETVFQSDLDQTVLGILASINIKVNSYNIASCHPTP